MRWKYEAFACTSRNIASCVPRDFVHTLCCAYIHVHIPLNRKTNSTHNLELSEWYPGDRWTCVILSSIVLLACNRNGGSPEFLWDIQIVRSPLMLQLEFLSFQLLRSFEKVINIFASKEIALIYASKLSNFHWHLFFYSSLTV